jgi:hypothetical protein
MTTSHDKRAPVIMDRRSLLVLAGSAALPWFRLSYAAKLEMACIPESTKMRLLELARIHGRLAVIIGLAVPSRSEDEPARLAAQQESTARVRAQLLKDLSIVATNDGSLSGPGITNVKLFETIPFLALTAEPGALEHLLAHPLVESVQEDSTVPPG